MARMSFDTRSQNAWKELIEKEALTRVSWHRTFEPQRQEDEWFKRAFYQQATSKPIGRSLPAIVVPPRPKPRSDTQEAMNQLTKKLDAERNPNALKEMYPVRREHRDLLRNGFSKEGKGRWEYLNARQEMSPEHKYQYPLSTTMEYGWKLAHSGQEYRTPAHARSKTIEDSFYRPNGAF